MVDRTTTEQSNQPHKSIQFRLSTIFVLTLVAGILAAFLSPHGNDMMLAGLVTTVTSLIFALAVGYVRPPLVDRVFWGIVVAAMMQAVCANVILLDRTGIYAWPLVAGFAAVAASGNSVGGALLTILVDVTKWLEQSRRIPQPAIGLALVLAAIGFSIVAPKVIPGW